MERGRKLYVAYGSNMDTRQMAGRCPTGKVVGKGVILNRELLFRGRPGKAVATVEPKAGEDVPVVIWEIGPEDERNLDVYEGYPRLYGKQDIRVRIGSDTQTIMAYTMNQGFPINRPSIRYLNTIASGYLQAGIKMNYLTQSVQKCMEKAEPDYLSAKVKEQYQEVLEKELPEHRVLKRELLNSEDMEFEEPDFEEPDFEEPDFEDPDWEEQFYNEQDQTEQAEDPEPVSEQKEESPWQTQQFF